jgi:hypothetical protein
MTFPVVSADSDYRLPSFEPFGLRLGRSGDRHSFQAGTLAESLAPKSFRLVGVEFVTGSISAPGLFEAAEYNVTKTNPLRAIYLYQPAGDTRPQPRQLLADAWCACQSGITENG